MTGIAKNPSTEKRGARASMTTTERSMQEKALCGIAENPSTEKQGVRASIEKAFTEEGVHERQGKRSVRDVMLG